MAADRQTQAAATALLDLCKAKRLMVATAESCTGGLVAGALTDIAGSSAVVERGFVTYTNEAKEQMLGVPARNVDGTRRGQPSRPPKRWRRACSHARLPILRFRSPASPVQAAARPRSPSGLCISRRLRAAAS